MDKLANRLRKDAEGIEAAVSDELDYRIAASLRSVKLHEDDVDRVKSKRPVMFWLASSLTGIVAAVAVIVIINFQHTEAPMTPAPTNIVAAVPVIDWKAETAMLTGQLQQELDALQSDIKKVEEKVRADIGL